MLTLRVTDQLLQTVLTCLFWDQQAWVFSFSRQDTPRPLNQHDLLHRRRRSFQCLQKKGDAFTSVARHSPKTLELRDSFELICWFFSNLLLRTKNNVSSPRVPLLIYCCWWIGWTRSGKFHRSVTHPAAAITVLLWLQAFFFNVEVKLEVMMDEKETDIMKEKKKWSMTSLLATLSSYAGKSRPRIMTLEKMQRATDDYAAARRRCLFSVSVNWNLKREIQTFPDISSRTQDPDDGTWSQVFTSPPGSHHLRPVCAMIWFMMIYSTVRQIFFFKSVWKTTLTCPPCAFKQVLLPPLHTAS